MKYEVKKAKYDIEFEAQRLINRLDPERFFCSWNVGYIELQYKSNGSLIRPKCSFDSTRHATNDCAFCGYKQSKRL